FTLGRPCVPVLPRAACVPEKDFSGIRARLNLELTPESERRVYKSKLASRVRQARNDRRKQRRAPAPQPKSQRPFSISRAITRRTRSQFLQDQVGYRRGQSHRST